ncbi:MAG: 3-dehydroquinate synthase [Alphaproteobacteria bacterium]
MDPEMDASAAPVTTVPVALGERAYDSRIGPGLLECAGAHSRRVARHDRLLVVADATVARLHWPRLAGSLVAAGFRADLLEVPAGEASKGFDVFSDLLERALALGIDRRTTVVALGGGVVGDLAGFAAAVLLRGLDYVQIPTTLLAQVDSSVGGKTAINARAGKNLVGAFHQPRLVLADLDALATLPRRELLAGYAEVVKYGLIDRPAFFDWLNANGMAALDGDMTLLAEAVAECCRAKAEVVAADEREAGRRALLTLGHTFGHAFEAEAGYDGGLLHGEGVAIGMALAFRHSARLGLVPMDEALAVERSLAATGLPVRPDLSGNRPIPTVEALLARMRSDKKALDGKVTLILARGIGKSFVQPDAEVGPIRETLEEALRP